MPRFSTRRAVSYGSFSLYGSRGRRSRNRNVLGFLFFIAVLALPVMLHSRSDDPAASQGGTSVAPGREYRPETSAGAQGTLAARQLPPAEQVAEVEAPATPAEAPSPAVAPARSHAEAQESKLLAISAEARKPKVKAKTQVSSVGVLAQAGTRKKARASRALAAASHAKAKPELARQVVAESKPALAYNTGSMSSYRSRGLVAAPK